MRTLPRLAAAALLAAGAAGLSGCVSDPLLAAGITATGIAVNNFPRQTRTGRCAGPVVRETVAIQEACPIIDISHQTPIRGCPTPGVKADIWPRGHFACRPGGQIIRKTGYARDPSFGWRELDEPRLLAVGYCDLDNRGRSRGADLRGYRRYSWPMAREVGWRGRKVSPSWFYGNGWRRDTNTRWERAANMDWRGGYRVGSWRQTSGGELERSGFRSAQWGRNRFKDFDTDPIRDYDPAWYSVNKWGGTYRVR